MSGKTIRDIAASDATVKPLVPSMPTIDELLASDGSITEVTAPPHIDTDDVDEASLEYSQHRTKLSTHRTALSTRRTDLSGRRTGMSFQRTRLSAERTLMSVIRTSLSLISFGFTIYQFLGHLADRKILSGTPYAARNFGLALLYLGVGLMVAGIAYHVRFMWNLRGERDALRADHMIHGRSGFPVSYTLLAAIALLLLGIVASASLTFQVGPFE